MANVITIPKKLTREGDLVVISRREYEDFLAWRKTLKTFRPTPAQKKDLKRARKDFAQGKYITLDELKRELEPRHSS